MKNLKKVLALVLAFAMAFTMAAGAVAFDDVQPGDDYSAAISMLSDLDVISGNGKGSYEPAKTITRAEACVLMANIMNGGKADTARFAGGSNFSDVAHGWWGESAIAYCVQNGITYGVGGGKFAPSREITDAEFVAMLTRAMGYDTAANPLSFPYGNYTAAVNNGLLDNMPYAEGSACTKGESAQIIYDALFADYARLTANLNVIHNADDHDEEGATLIEDVFGLTRASNKNDGDTDSKTEKCTQHYFVIEGYDCSEKDTTIATTELMDKDFAKDDYREFECEFDITPFVGYAVVLWGEDSHGSDDDVDTIKAIEVVDGQVAYDYDPTMADSKDNDELDVYDDLEVDNETDLNIKNGYSYKLIDWDNDGVVDYEVVTVIDYYGVTGVTSKKVKLDGPTGAIELEKDGESTVNGQTVICDLIDLEKGDIVAINKSDLCEYDHEIVWTMEIVEPVSKEVTDIEAKSDKVYFDGEFIDITNDGLDFNGAYDKYDELDEDDDTEYDLWLNENGYIIKLEVSSESYGYLLVRGQGDGETDTNERKLATIDVTYDDGTSADDVKIAKDATVPGYVKSTRVLGNDLVGRAYKYQANEDGVITKMVQVATEQVRATYAYDDEEEMLHVGQDALTERFWMDDCDVVFVVKVDTTDVATTVAWNRAAQKAEVTYTDVMQIDEYDVKVVEYTELPDIGYSKTEALGAQFDSDVDDVQMVDGVAVLGVDTFKYFDDITTTIALVTEVSYKPASEKYTVTAIIPGEEAETFTAKEGDLDPETIASLDAAELLLADDNGGADLEMLYAELEFTDGVLSAFANTDAAAVGSFDESEADYDAGRFVLIRETNAGKLVLGTVTATSNSTADVKYSVDTVGTAYELASDVAFYEIDDEVVVPGVIKGVQQKFSTLDGFVTDDIEKLDERAGYSYFNDLSFENEYQMADVVINDDGKIVMIVYYTELVDAAEYIAPEDTYEYDVQVSIPTKEENAGKLLVKIFERSVDGETGDKSEWKQIKVKKADAVLELVAKEAGKDVTDFNDPNAWLNIEFASVDVAPGTGSNYLVTALDADGNMVAIEAGDMVSVNIPGYDKVVDQILK